MSNHSYLFSISFFIVIHTHFQASSNSPNVDGAANGRFVVIYDGEVIDNLTNMTDTGDAPAQPNALTTKYGLAIVDDDVV
ncbi:hypothetical protein N9189_02020 [Pirellulaceae bacterium]|jgi:hypothetical protein|nr:hypothetical protein [Pirellulaceae bacterium]